MNFNQSCLHFGLDQYSCAVLFCNCRSWSKPETSKVVSLVIIVELTRERFEPQMV